MRPRELEELVELIVGAAGIVVVERDAADIGAASEIDDVFDGAVAPTHVVAVLGSEVLRVVDEQIGAADETGVGVVVTVPCQVAADGERLFVWFMIRRVHDDGAVHLDPVAEGEGQWCIATGEQPGVRIQRCSRWNPHGDGSELWSSFSANGSIPDSNNDRRSSQSDPASAALAVQCRLEPGQSIEIPVVISWDLPVTAFATGTSALRRYTDFFGSSGGNATAIAAEGLRDWRRWREQIEAWQQPVLERSDLPEPLRMALFNEL